MIVLVAAKTPVRTYHPVAGDDEGKRIGCQCITNSTGTAGIAQVLCDESICAYFSAGDSIHGTATGPQRVLIKVKNNGSGIILFARFIRITTNECAGLLVYRNDVSVGKPVPGYNVPNSNGDGFPEHGATNNNCMEFTIFTARVAVFRKACNQFF